MHTHVQDADKEEPHECGIERYFYTSERKGCFLRQFRGYEVEVLPKNIPVREVTLHTYVITIMYDTAHWHIQVRSLELTQQAC